ncbi:DUF445 family protein [Thermaerobacillus caldiproteolyticus]|uniref:DUF445 family protein n=1 Tax=Thermaerobacillus caldiproteolyticus TaxID=247480 RepID=UPI0018F1E02C|nr:DUF445 family protein [Anoxybacillus caldiproteolyticus]
MLTEWNKLIDYPFTAIEELVGKERIQQSIHQFVARTVEKTLADVVVPYQAKIMNEWIPKVVSIGGQWLSGQVEEIVQRLQLADIVRSEVETFSVERLEEMILSISQREFKMITYLGALLGGLIRILQGIVGLWI